MMILEGMKHAEPDMYFVKVFYIPPTGYQIYFKKNLGGCRKICEGAICSVQCLQSKSV